MVKTILIDGRFVGVGESMTRYVLEFFSRILELDTENQYTMVIRPQGEKELRRYPIFITAKNFKTDILDIPHYSKAEQTKFLKYLNQKKYDLVHFIQFNHPVLYRGDFVTTIHDLTLIGHLHYFNFFKQLAFNLVMRDAARRSKKIIAISKATMRDITDYYNIPKNKFAVIYESVDHDRYNERVKREKLKVKSFKEKYGIAGDYLLYTGMWKKHKNLQRLFTAFLNFKEKTGNPIQLVLTGKIDQKEPEVIARISEINKTLDFKFNISNSIATTGFIEEEELPLAYAGALAYIIPSLSEGFGLPPLEAMACGTPVISSKESCMPEILGDAPLYFDPYDEKSIEESIEKIACDEKLREYLINKGLERVKKYSWDKTAAQTLAVYKEVFKTSNL